MPRLSSFHQIDALALHPTCSSTRLGLNQSALAVARAAAAVVVIPDDWGCCAFAGDRGLLHPELTASATASERMSLESQDLAAYASTNRTCELGMTRATNREFSHVLEVLEATYRQSRESPAQPGA